LAADGFNDKLQRLALVFTGDSPTPGTLEVDAREYRPDIVFQTRIRGSGYFGIVRAVIQSLYPADKITLHSRLDASRIPEQLDGDQVALLRRWPDAILRQ
jgi:hypothetical protein